MPDTYNPDNPINQPDPTPLKSANLFEAIEAIKSDFPKHCDWSEVDYYFEEMHADSERNRKLLILLKHYAEQSDNNYLLNQLKKIKL